MAGEITCSTPVYCDNETDIDTAVSALVLTAATDVVHVIPWKNGCLVFSTVRAA